MCSIFVKMCCFWENVLFWENGVLTFKFKLYSLISKVSHSTRKDKHIPLQTNEIGSRISWIKTTNPITRSRALGVGRPLLKYPIVPKQETFVTLHFPQTPEWNFWNTLFHEISLDVEQDPSTTRIPRIQTIILSYWRFCY